MGEGLPRGVLKHALQAEGAVEKLRSPHPHLPAKGREGVRGAESIF